MSDPSPAPLTLLDLPDDVLICIFSHCDIETLLTARLVCTTPVSAIDLYIKIIAPRAAQTTFPGYNLVLAAPADDCSLKWLRRRIPAQLFNIILDKDKLRRYPYANSGFHHGTPYESKCEVVKLCRAKIAVWWRALRAVYLVSEEVGATSEENFGAMYGRVEENVRVMRELKEIAESSRWRRWWQAVSGPVSAGAKNRATRVFTPKSQELEIGTVDTSLEHDALEKTHQSESVILHRRQTLIKRLPDEDLRCYMYLWRVLQWWV
jgi:hypothetical protein